MNENKYKIEDTLIVINSSNRVDKIKTHDKFPKGITNWVYAVPHDQYESYEDVLGREHTYPIPPTVAQFLPSQRQHCMEYFGQVYKYIFFMDDDLTFLKRKVVETEDVDLYGKNVKKYRCKKAKKKDVLNMIWDVRTALDEFHMVGVSTRLGNNRVTEPHADTNRVTRCYALSAESFKAVGAVFNPFEPFVAEDFHMTLCYLNAGYNNRVLYNYAQEDVGSNAEGGCSEYRTLEVQNRTAEWMNEHHKEVTLKAKESANWKGMEDGMKGNKIFRNDMIIGWKKAYKPIKKRVDNGWGAKFSKK